MFGGRGLWPGAREQRCDRRNVKERDEEINTRPPGHATGELVVGSGQAVRWKSNKSLEYYKYRMGAAKGQ